MDTIKNRCAMLALGVTFVVMVGIGNGEEPKPVFPTVQLATQRVQIGPCVPQPVEPPGVVFSRKHVPFGPFETASFEEALSRESFDYDRGIWPRKEKLKRALSADRIPKGTVKHLEKWLARVLKKEIHPTEGNWNRGKWLGLPEFRLGSDYILGQLTSKSKDIEKIQFQAIDQCLYLTVHSDTLFPREIEKVDEARAKAVLTSILNLPDEAVRKMTIQYSIEKLGKDKTPTCCGCLYYFTDEWYRKIPFWFTKDRGFVSIPTLSEEELEKRAIAVSRFAFKGMVRPPIKGEPPQPPVGPWIPYQPVPDFPPEVGPPCIPVPIQPPPQPPRSVQPAPASRPANGWAPRATQLQPVYRSTVPVTPPPTVYPSPVIVPSGGTPQMKYAPLGPLKTASFEKALCMRHVSYSCGVWPRKEKLQDALPSSRIPENTVKKLEGLLAQVVKKEVQPAKGDWKNSKWLGLPEFRWFGYDFIIGRLTSESKDVKEIEFQATDRDLYITFHSDTLLPREIDKADDAQVKAFLASVLNLSKKDVRGMKIKCSKEELGEKKIPVCHGKACCPTYQWQQEIRFWIKKGQGFVSVTTIHMKDGFSLQSPVASRFPFKGLKRPSSTPVFCNPYSEPVQPSIPTSPGSSPMP